MTVSNITRLIPTMQAATMLSHNVPKKGKKKRIIKTGVENIVSLAMLKKTAQYV